MRALTAQGTYGAFAVVYSRTAIPYILRWMEEVKRAYDNQWDFLRLKGIKVGVPWPPHASATPSPHL